VLSESKLGTQKTKLKKILTAYRSRDSRDKFYIALGEREHIIVTCYDSIVECVERALRDYHLEEYIESEEW
jgi:hypothetical protein